jgi:two-component system, NarL family, invasion response regulator UvrY
VLRTVIVDDDRAMRIVGRLLAEEEGCRIVGEAETGEQAVRLAMRLNPDAILMDFRMTGMDGVEATRAILAARPNVAVIAWTSSDDAQVAEAFRRAGARAHALKGDFDALRAALRDAQKTFATEA